MDKLLWRLDQRMDKGLEADPECIKNGDSALALVVPTKQLCVEMFRSTRIFVVSLSVS